MYRLGFEPTWFSSLSVLVQHSNRSANSNERTDGILNTNINSPGYFTKNVSKNDFLPGSHQAHHILNFLIFEFLTGLILVKWNFYKYIENCFSPGFHQDIRRFQICSSINLNFKTALALIWIFCGFHTYSSNTQNRKFSINTLIHYRMETKNYFLPGNTDEWV